MLATILFRVICLLSKNLKITVYKNLLFCMGMKLCLSLQEEDRLRMSDNMVLREIFGLKEKW
jgi:hypothetical protein